MKKYKNLAGYRFGRLTVKELAGKAKSGKVCWRCSCDCGNVVIVRGCDLLSGHTKSCGCFKAEIRKIVHTKHGARKNNTAERLYLVWKNIKKRCENKNAPAYPDYGGRGITLCDEWHDYATFRKWAMENGYNTDAARGNCTIDRIDNDGNYSPENCRWVNMESQSNNRRSNRFLTFNGQTNTLSQWAEKLGISAHTLSQRLNAYGWSIQKALTTPCQVKYRNRSDGQKGAA